MVHLEELAALDLLLWVGTGQEAARRLQCNQSTISRRVACCQAVFALKMGRRHGEWHLHDRDRLIDAERVVHQQHRLRLQRGLRLEACNWAGRVLAEPLPPAWQPGGFDQLSLRRPLQLLKNRVIDAWLTNHGQELQGRGDLVRYEICRMPTWLMADRLHPLAGARGLLAADLAGFPTLQFAAGLFPWFENRLQERGLWGDAARSRHYRREEWEGRTADQLTLCTGNLLGRALDPEGPVVLDWDLGLESILVLAVLPDLAEHPAILELLELLRQRWRALRAPPAGDRECA
ncbi:MAG: LysR family transcriptional regulator [Cyanobium sp.]